MIYDVRLAKPGEEETENNDSNALQKKKETDRTGENRPVRISLVDVMSNESKL